MLVETTLKAIKISARLSNEDKSFTMDLESVPREAKKEHLWEHQENGFEQTRYSTNPKVLHVLLVTLTEGF